MIDDRQEELAALHALGLLDEGEREPFVAELGRSFELIYCARTPKDAGMKLLFKPHVPEHLPPLPLRLPEGPVPELWAPWLTAEVRAAS